MPRLPGTLRCDLLSSSAAGVKSHNRYNVFLSVKLSILIYTVSFRSELADNMRSELLAIVIPSIDHITLRIFHLLTFANCMRSSLVHGAGFLSEFCLLRTCLAMLSYPCTVEMQVDIYYLPRLCRWRWQNLYTAACR